MNIQDLYDALAAHDWHYAMSDDGRVFIRGVEAEKRLAALAASIKGGDALLKSYSAHVFSGAPWGTPKLPKPERP